MQPRQTKVEKLFRQTFLVPVIAVIVIGGIVGGVAVDVVVGTFKLDSQQSRCGKKVSISFSFFRPEFFFSNFILASGGKVLRFDVSSSRHDAMCCRKSFDGPDASRHCYKWQMAKNYNLLFLIRTFAVKENQLGSQLRPNRWGIIVEFICRLRCCFLWRN